MQWYRAKWQRGPTITGTDTNISTFSYSDGIISFDFVDSTQKVVFIVSSGKPARPNYIKLILKTTSYVEVIKHCISNRPQTFPHPKPMVLVPKPKWGLCFKNKKRISLTPTITRSDTGAYLIESISTAFSIVRTEQPVLCYFQWSGVPYQAHYVSCVFFQYELCHVEPQVRHTVKNLALEGLCVMFETCWSRLKH